MITIKGLTDTFLHKCNYVSQHDTQKDFGCLNLQMFKLLNISSLYYFSKFRKIFKYQVFDPYIYNFAQ